MNLSKNIILERVTITDKDENCYQATYKGEKYHITKSDETSFDLNHISSPSHNLRLGLEQRLDISGMSVLQDETAPEDYKEVMIFHELREIEYQEAGFDDGHERAVNDEILYVLKFFGEKKLKHYLKFANEYRTKALEKRKKNEIEMNPRYSLVLQYIELGNKLRVLFSNSVFVTEKEAPQFEKTYRGYRFPLGTEREKRLNELFSYVREFSGWHTGLNTDDKLYEESCKHGHLCIGTFSNPTPRSDEIVRQIKHHLDEEKKFKGKVVYVDTSFGNIRCLKEITIHSEKIVYEIGACGSDAQRIVKELVKNI